MRALLIGFAFSTAFVLLLPAQATASANVVALSGGGRHTCALTEGRSILCWGLNADGQLGDGTNDSSSLPVDVVGLGERIAEVSAGLTHTCAVTTTGTARCWGENGGRLGNGSEEASTVPVDVCADATCSSALNNVASIAAGGFHSCAVLNDGTVLCWGNDEDGQLGDGTTVDSLTPVVVSGLAEVSAVSLGTSSSCALTNAGAVFCWGSNVEGQIGDDRACGMRCPLPQLVSGLESAVAQVSVGGLHACALTGLGAVLCWGFNFDGQVGDGTEDNIRIVPTQVFGLEGGVDAVSVGGRFRGHGCALLNSGTLRCWGDNDSGQVGDGSTDDRIAPVVVPELEGVVSIAAGDAHMCAITNGSDILCWGSNSAGQFGDGMTDDSLTPVLVVPGKTPASIVGDANCDGDITSIDAALILQFTAGILGDLPCNADANGDGNTDAIDAALVLQFTAGLLESL